MSKIQKPNRETALSKEFYETYDDCEKRNDLCKSLNCDCGRRLMHLWLSKQINMHFESDKYYSITICPKWDEREKYELIEFDQISSAKYLAKRLKSLKIPGFRGAFFLDIEKQKTIKNEATLEKIWHPHWHGIFKSDIDEKFLKKMIYKAFNTEKGFQRARITEVIKKPYNTTYPLKLITEHKYNLKLMPYGRIKFYRHVTGAWLKLLKEFYKERNINKCMFFIGFRRNGNALISIQRSYDKPMIIKRKLCSFKKRTH